MNTLLVEKEIQIQILEINAFRIEMPVTIKGKPHTLKCIATFEDDKGNLLIELTYNIKAQLMEGKLALKLDHPATYLKDKDKLKEIALEQFNRYAESMLWDFEDIHTNDNSILDEEGNIKFDITEC